MAKGADKLVEKVEVHGTGWVVGRGTRPDEERELGDG